MRSRFLRSQVLLAAVSAALAIGVASCGSSSSTGAASAGGYGAGATTPTTAAPTTAAAAAAAVAAVAATETTSASDAYKSAAGASATTPAAAPTSPAPATAAAVATSAPAGAAAVSIQISQTSLGKILTDGAGMTLYLFTKDTPTTSACSAGCAAAWPAVVASGTPSLGAGLDASDFGTITRSDGAKQVTFYGHPLYSYAQDAKPGDVTGQNVGKVWFVLDAEGNAVPA